jgi:hypothetical protein
MFIRRRKKVRNNRVLDHRIGESRGKKFGKKREKLF